MYIVAAENASYSGQNEKYHDLWNLTPGRKFAKQFETPEEANDVKNYLHMLGWTEFEVIEI